ncbi:hypothetical protein ABZY44_30290 [Streptomyces sp. NPDC006544]|uniref:hypothetical protein n=1 Tax=Streptomyces sp. NPDC006544 TaxID=3154583 RepID=UPI0033B6CCF7
MTPAQVSAARVRERAARSRAIAGTGRQHFGADRNFTNLDRSARRAAWRMIRREAGYDEG